MSPPPPPDFAALAEHSPDVIARIDRAGRHLYVNRAAERATGLAAEAFVGRTHAELAMAPAVVAVFDRHLRTAFDSGQAQAFTFEYPTPAGPRWFEVRLLPEWTPEETAAPASPDPAPGAAAPTPDATVLAIGRDVTAQRATETALRESEARFRQLAASIGDVFWLSDVAPRRVVYASPAFERVWGVPVEALYADPDVVVPLLHPDDRDEALAAFARMRRQEDTEHEFRIVHPDGGVRWLSARMYPVRDAGGGVSRVAGVATDVTARKAAELALRDSEERFRQLAEHTRQAFWMIDAATRRALYISPAFEAIWGIPRDRVYAAPAAWLEAIHPEDRARVLASAPATVATGVGFDIEYRVVRPDGEVRWVHDRGFPVRDDRGAVYRVAGIAEDVTTRMAAEASVRASEARFRTLFEHAADAIAVHDGAGRLLAVNDRLCELVGRTRDELLAMRVADLEAQVQLPELERLWAGMAPGTTRTLDGTLRHKDGRTIPVENRLTVVEEGGERVYYVLLRDVRARRALEAQLRQAQKMEAVGQLAGGVAHDFNNLLQVIQGHARFALDGLPPASEVREDLEAVHAAGERAAELTRQLLAFSRKQVQHPRVLDVNAVVRRVTSMLDRLLGEDIAVVTRLAPALGTATADPAQLEQVLVNLAVNARDAMPGGGTLVFETAEVELGPGLEADVSDGTDGEVPAPGHYVRLTVRDTGAGMDEATRARAFEPFFTTKPVGKGTGLGLSTVYGVVRQSGGWVRLASAPGAGTAVEVDLPRTGPAERATDAAETAPRPARARGAGTVLVVEDEPAVRKVVTRLLADAGYTVLEAADGAGALALAAAHPGPLDLVLTDVVMPGMSGRAFAERLAAERPGARVLFMSGYTDSEILRRGLDVPGAGFLEKPFSHAALLDAVRGAAGPRRADPPP